MVALFVILTILFFLTLDYFVQKGQARKAAALAAASAATAYAPAPRPAPVPKAPARADLPAGVFVARGHTWLQLEPSGAARVGVDGLAPTILGEVDRIDVLAAGTPVRKGDPIVTLARGKRRLTLRAPVDGTITRVNHEAAGAPARLAREPFAAWLYSLTPTNLADALRSMTVAEEAAAWMRREAQRLRDFLAPALAPATAGSTLHDGGEPVEGAAERLSDEQFEKLAEAFFAGER